MVTAVFNNTDTARVHGLWQWDYGQVLRIQGLSLNPAVEVHFSLNETGGEAPPRVGVTHDGVTDVVIPDSMLENGGTTQDYNIYAWIYITDETSGKTTKKITLYVKSRPKPQAFSKPEDAQLFREAIAAVNESALEAQKSEKSAEAWAHGDYENYPERDEDNAAYYAGIAGENAGSAHDSMVETQRLASQVHSDADATAQNTALTAQYKTQAAQSAAEALQSEQNAKTSETAAQEAQAGAETAEGQAQLFAGQARADKETVSADKETVLLARDEAISARNTAIENANIATNKADETEADRAEVEHNKNIAGTYMESAIRASEESKDALNQFMSALSSQPKRYYRLSIEEMNAIENPNVDDLCYVVDLANSRTAIYFYDNDDIDGDNVNPEWQFLGNAEFAQMDRSTLLKVLNLATVALTGSYTDLVDIPNRYDSPLVLDGTAETVTWDYAQSDTAIVTLTENKPLAISNPYNGCVAVIQCYGAQLDFSDASLYNKSATMDYIEPLEAEHITYTLIYNAGKWDVTALPYAGGEASA